MEKNKFDIYLKRVCQATNLKTQTELACALKINRSAITQARKKDCFPDKWFMQLFRLYGINPEWIESGTGTTFIKGIKQEISNEFVKIPKVKARLCAGGGSFEADSNIESYFLIQREWFKNKGNPDKMVLMGITGTSMEPSLKDGDTVLINEGEKKILAGAIYAVGVDDTIMVKRLEKHPNKLVLLSDNQSFMPVFFKAEDMESVRIIGKVIWCCRDI